MHTWLTRRRDSMIQYDSTNIQLVDLDFNANASTGSVPQLLPRHRQNSLCCRSVEMNWQELFRRHSVQLSQQGFRLHVIRKNIRFTTLESTLIFVQSDDVLHLAAQLSSLYVLACFGRGRRDLSRKGNRRWIDASSWPFDCWCPHGVSLADSVLCAMQR